MLLLRCWDLWGRCYVTCYYAVTRLLRSLGSLLRYLLLLPADNGACVAAMTVKSQKSAPQIFPGFQINKSARHCGKITIFGHNVHADEHGFRGCFCSCSYSCSCSLVCSCFCSCSFSCCCCCCPRVRLRPRLKLMMVVFTTSLPWRAPPCYRPGLAGICGLQKPLDGGKGANVTSETLDFSHMFCMSLVRCPTYCWHGGFCTKHTETLHFYISCCCCCLCFSFCSCLCSCSCSSSCSCVCFCFCCGCVTSFSSLTRSPLLRPGSAD